MQEQNQNQTVQSSPKQVCSIRIMFPVDTDEEGINYKRKITNILSPIPDAQIQFSLMTGPPPMPPR